MKAVITFLSHWKSPNWVNGVNLELTPVQKKGHYQRKKQKMLNKQYKEQICMLIQDHFDLPSWFPNSGCTLRCGWVEIVWYWEQTSERIFEKNLGKLEDIMCTHKGKYFYSYIIVSTRIIGEYLKAEINRISSKVWTLSRLIWFSTPCQTLTFAQKGNSVWFVYVRRIWMPLVPVNRVKLKFKTHFTDFRIYAVT